MLKAIKIDNKSIIHASGRLKLDYEFMEDVIKKFPNVYNFLSENDKIHYQSIYSSVTVPSETVGNTGLGSGTGTGPRIYSRS